MNIHHSSSSGYFIFYIRQRDLAHDILNRFETCITCKNVVYLMCYFIMLLQGRSVIDTGDILFGCAIRSSGVENDRDSVCVTRTH